LFAFQNCVPVGIVCAPGTRGLLDTNTNVLETSKLLGDLGSSLKLISALWQQTAEGQVFNRAFRLGLAGLAFLGL
jgi:hypothetical protein